MTQKFTEVFSVATRRETVHSHLSQKGCFENSKQIPRNK